MLLEVPVGSAKSIALSDGQLICLELISQNLTSKDIGLRLGISPHTVDQRVRRALRILGAANRRQAALLIKQERFGQVEAPFSELVSMRLSLDLANLQLPFATRSRRTNEMSISQRLFWIVAIAVSAAVSTLMYLAGLESLSRLLARHGG